MSERGDSQATCWTMIQGAAAGEAGPRADFARRYEPLVRRVLGRRWRGTRLAGEVEDAAQEVFVECLRARGVLDRVEPERPGGFRAFLLGAVRNVAGRLEDERRRPLAGLDDAALAQLAADEPALEAAFEREWARCLVVQAAEHHRRGALPRGSAARRRVELLHLRFHEGLPIRAVAAHWGEDPARVHAIYRVARREFEASLRSVVAFHHPDCPDLDAECRRLLERLGGD